MKLKVEEGFTIKGRARITVREADTGEVVKSFEAGNLLTNDGLKLILDKFSEDASGTATTGPDYIWVGWGSTAAANTDTDLAVYKNEKALSGYVRSAAEYTGTLTVTFDTADANHQWSEIGLGNGAHAAGILISRVVLTAAQEFNKTNTQQVTVDYDLTAARG